MRELVPEFFYSPLFLENINRHDFGIKQSSNQGVDDVELPVWAMNDPLLFVHRHRQARDLLFIFDQSRSNRSRVYRLLSPIWCPDTCQAG